MAPPYNHQDDMPVFDDQMNEDPMMNFDSFHPLNLRIDEPVPII